MRLPNESPALATKSLLRLGLDLVLLLMVIIGGVFIFQKFIFPRVVIAPESQARVAQKQLDFDLGRQRAIDQASVEQVLESWSLDPEDPHFARIPVGTAMDLWIQQRKADQP